MLFFFCIGICICRKGTRNPCDNPISDQSSGMGFSRIEIRVPVFDTRVRNRPGCSADGDGNDDGGGLAASMRAGELNETAVGTEDAQSDSTERWGQRRRECTCPGEEHEDTIRVRHAARHVPKDCGSRPVQTNAPWSDRGGARSTSCLRQPLANRPHQTSTAALAILISVVFFFLFFPLL